LKIKVQKNQIKSNIYKPKNRNDKIKFKEWLGRILKMAYEVSRNLGLNQINQNT